MRFAGFIPVRYVFRTFTFPPFRVIYVVSKMNAPYRTDLVPGCRGTVRFVDDMGTIHVSWDIGSSLGVVYGEDACKLISNE